MLPTGVEPRGQSCGLSRLAASRAGQERPPVLAVKNSIVDGGKDHVGGHMTTEELQGPEIRQQSSCPTQHTHNLILILLILLIIIKTTIINNADNNNEK